MSRDIGKTAAGWLPTLPSPSKYTRSETWVDKPFRARECGSLSSKGSDVEMKPQRVIEVVHEFKSECADAVLGRH